MAEQNLNCVQEAVCIHTKKIYDSCRDKDCITDLRVFPTSGSQAIIDSASNLRGKSAELIYVDVDVKLTPFTKGCYTVEIRYYYKITAETYSCGVKGAEVEGLAIFDKKVILYGNESGAKVFSTYECNPGSALPAAVVEAVDPVLLSLQVAEYCPRPPYPYPPRPCPPGPGPIDPPCCSDQEQNPNCPVLDECELQDLPAAVLDAFDEPLVLGDQYGRRVLVTLGQFSIVRLERDAQLMIPVYDVCIPTKDCVAADATNMAPCDLFKQIAFPMDSFFPPTVENSCTAFTSTAGATSTGNTCTCTCNCG